MRCLPCTALALLAACNGTDYRLVPAGPDLSDPAAAALPAADLGLELAPLGGGAADGAWESVPDDGGSVVIRKESFSFDSDGRTPVVDTLFVLDDSMSMRTVVDQLRAGFAGLVDADVWPEGARIAVMNTVPARPQTVAVTARSAVARVRPSKLARWFPGIEHGPGFVRLVDRESLADFREYIGWDVYPSVELAGCDAWFAPGETNADGIPCIVAHTQIAQQAVRIEAGLTSFRQLVARQGDVPLFRPGAAANVVFVSDTHDPGISPPAPESPRYEAWQALIDARPTAAELVGAIDASNDVAAVRFHAIAPLTTCGETWHQSDPVYFDMADATGGATIDICQAEDYTPVIAELAERGGEIQRPVFALGSDADQVRSVTLDGEPVDYQLVGRGRALRLDTRLGDGQRLDVLYDRQTNTGAPVTPKGPRKRSR